MVVDNNTPDWLTEEQGYKPSTGPATVSKRQGCRGLVPLVEFESFNTIEDLKKDYLVHSPSNWLTDPTFGQEREGVVNRIAIDCITMKTRISGLSLSITLPPPREAAIPFPWRPVPEHLVNLPRIGEPLLARDQPWSQIGQLPQPLSQTSQRRAQLSGDATSHTSAIPDPTPPLGQNSTPLCFSSQNSALLPFPNSALLHFHFQSYHRCEIACVCTPRVG